MKHSTRMILIIICIVIIIFLIGVLALGIIMKDKSYHGNLKIVKEEQYSIEQIEEISIITSSSDVMFYGTEEHKVKIVEKSKKSLNSNDLFQVTNDHGVLKVDGKKHATNFCIGFCIFPDVVYEIYLPSHYTKKVTVQTISGDILFNTLGTEQLSKVTMNTTSGDIKLKSKIESEQVSLKSTSGDINTIYIRSLDIDIKTVSGDINHEYIEGENITLKTTSGDIENHSVKGKVQIETISGDIEIDRFDIRGESQITSKSGDIEVGMDRDATCRMSADSISGDIHFPHSESIIGSGEHSLYFKTISGDIDVQFIH